MYAQNPQKTSFLTLCMLRHEVDWLFFFEYLKTYKFVTMNFTCFVRVLGAEFQDDEKAFSLVYVKEKDSHLFRGCKITLVIVPLSNNLLKK